MKAIIVYKKEVESEEVRKKLLHLGERGWEEELRK